MNNVIIVANCWTSLLHQCSYIMSAVTEEFHDIELAEVGSDCPECAICIHSCENGENVLALSCNHVYHFECLVQLLETSLRQRIEFKCPLCRHVEMDAEQYQNLFDEYIRIHGLPEEQQVQVVVTAVGSETSDEIDENEDYHIWIPGWIERQEQIERDREQAIRDSQDNIVAKFFRDLGVLVSSLCLLPMLCLTVGLVILVIVKVTT